MRRHVGVRRPGDLIFFGMLVTLALERVLHAGPWLVIIAALALGWFVNIGHKQLPS